MRMQQRYAAAEKLLVPVIAGKLRNAAPTVKWVGQTSECWYQRSTADGHEWVLVDADPGARRPAFAQRRLAELQQMGRTLCRERGGLYVSFSVVPGSLKKKKL